MASHLKDEGNRSFEAGNYEDAVKFYTRGISKDPTFVKLYTNRAMARSKLQAWEDCLNDCLKAIELKPDNFKAYFYLAQAQLNLKHPNEALSSALTAYDIGRQTSDQSTPKACELVLSAKKAKWEARERERLRQRNEMLRELEDSIKRTGFEQSHATVDPFEIHEIEESTRRKVEELYSLFAMADPANMTRREVPDYMIDQISFAFMHDPVITKSGQSYERTTIEAHLKLSETDPLTRQPLSKSDLRPNLALKQACAEFLENNGWAVEWIPKLPTVNTSIASSAQETRQSQQNSMDKGISSPQPLRSPLSSIINLSNPTSEETRLDDEIYNASPIDSNKSLRGSDSVEFGSENEPPQVQEATEVRLTSPTINQVNINRASRCLSLNLHRPTQLDSIAEGTNERRSQESMQQQRSRSVDEVRLMQTSSSNDGRSYLTAVRQYPTQPFDKPPKRAATPLGIPSFNTSEASRYRIPSPPRSLQERLNHRPSPERLSWLRQTSSLPRGAIMRAENGTLVMGLWQNPQSDHTGSGRQGFDPTRDPFHRPQPLGMHPINQAPANTPRDPESGLASNKKPEVKPFRRV